MAGKGTVLAKVGWPAKKFYLSLEAIELLRQHCEGTPLTMSAYLDLLIKQNLSSDSAVRRPTVAEPPAVSAERAKKAALDRGIEQVRGVRKQEDAAALQELARAAKQEKPFDL